MQDAEQIRARLDRYESFAAQDPSNVSLLAEVAELRMRVGDFASAEAALDKALALSPGNPSLRSQQAVLAIASSQFERAVALSQELIAEGVTAAAVRYNLAYALMYLGRHAEAKEHLQAISDLPDAPDGALLLLARSLHHLGDVEEAMIFLHRHLERKPQDVDAQGAMALLALDAEDLGSAKEWGEKALHGNGENLEALVTLGSLALERQDAVEAKTHFDKAVARHPKSGRAWAGAGLTEMLDMQLDKAKGDLERAVLYMPSHIGTWHALAWARIVSNDLAGAEAAFAKALEIDRNFGETHGGLAVIAVMQGRTAEAERMTRIALRLDSMSFAGRFAQSLLLARQGNTGAAQDAIQKILNSPVAIGEEALGVRLAQLLRERKKIK
jgi:tetratricopeptide (TPR) repeat protein